MKTVLAFAFGLFLAVAVFAQGGITIGTTPYGTGSNWTITNESGLVQDVNFGTAIVSSSGTVNGNLLPYTVAPGQVVNTMTSTDYAYKWFSCPAPTWAFDRDNPGWSMPSFQSSNVGCR